MAHYDCKNCGHRMGIDFGSCDNCTPKEYFEIEYKIKNINIDTNLHVKYHPEVVALKEKLEKEYLSGTEMEKLLKRKREIEAQYRSKNYAR